MIQSHEDDIKFTGRVSKENEGVFKKTPQLYTHDQSSPILELHGVIVHSDFQLLRSVFVRPAFFTALIAAVLIVVVILLLGADPVAVVFVAAAVLVFIAVTIVMFAVAIDGLHVDFWEVCWQIPGQNQHV